MTSACSSLPTAGNAAFWIWLEEDPTIRNDQDRKVFDRGMAEMFKELTAQADTGVLTEGRLYSMLKRHFDFFFGHRTEGQAIRLSWKQVKKLASALERGHKAETEKTEDY